MKSRGFYKGINLGGWLSQCDYSVQRMDNFIREEDFEIIKSWGLDHVRLPVDCDILEEKDGMFKEDGFARIDDAIRLAHRYGLNLVLDLHKAPGFSFGINSVGPQELFTEVAYQEQFYHIWEEFSRRFGKYSDMVAFELLNEVTNKEYIHEWNKIVRETVRRIRTYVPDILIIVGSYGYNSAEAVPALESLYDDNIVYNMHCYEPLKFTHQGAVWCSAVDPVKYCSFAESGICEDSFEQLFAPAIEKAKKEGVHLYCGEYGVIENSSPEDVLEWYKRINSVFERHSISRAAWVYREMEFGISDSRMDSVRETLLKYL